MFVFYSQWKSFLSASVFLLQATAREGEDWWVRLSWSLGIFSSSERARVRISPTKNPIYCMTLHRITFTPRHHSPQPASLCVRLKKTQISSFCLHQLWWIHASGRRWEKQQFRIKLRRFGLQCLYVNKLQWYCRLCVLNKEFSLSFTEEKKKKKKKKKSKKRKNKKHSEDSELQSDSDGKTIIAILI